VVGLVFCVFFLIVVSLVVSISAVDCLERLDSEMMYYVSSGTLNSIHSLYAVICTGICQVTCSVLVSKPS